MRVVCVKVGVCLEKDCGWYCVRFTVWITASVSVRVGFDIIHDTWSTFFIPSEMGGERTDIAAGATVLLLCGSVGSIPLTARR